MTSHEWDSATYHRLSDHQFAWGKKVLARVSLRGDETVLDAGCGSGRLTGELLKRLPQGRVVAVDLSENMLRTARRHLEPEFPGHVFVVCADLQALPFSDAFDGVFSTAAFHWVTDHPRLFRNLFQALKRGGWLEAQCGGGPNLARLRARAAELTAQAPYAEFFAGWPGPWEYADAPTTAARVRNAGFVNVETSIEPAQFCLSNPDEYRQYLATVTFHQHLARIPDPELRERFLYALAADPNFELDYWRLNLRGRRPDLI
jgi:ubiquinone/menaquinone biosynthesis C-methylase UbiE